MLLGGFLADAGEDTVGKLLGGEYVVVDIAVRLRIIYAQKMFTPGEPAYPAFFIYSYLFGHLSACLLRDDAHVCSARPLV